MSASPSPCWDFCLAWTCTGPVYAVMVSVSSCVHPSCYIWKMLFLWSHPTPLALIIFPPLLHGFQSAGAKELDEDILFKTECSKVSHFLCIVYLWVSVSSHSLQEASLTRLSETLCHMSLLVILLLCSFSRMIVVGFPPDLFLSFKSNFLKIRAQVLFQICSLGLSPPHLELVS